MVMLEASPEVYFPWTITFQGRASLIHTTHFFKLRVSRGKRLRGKKSKKIARAKLIALKKKVKIERVMVMLFLYI